MIISLLKAAVLACCVIITQTAPQHYVYYSPYTQPYSQPQHFGHFNGVVSPVSYNTGYNGVSYNPAVSYTPTASYSPAVSSSVPQSAVPQGSTSQDSPAQNVPQHVPAQRFPVQHVPARQVPQQVPSAQHVPQQMHHVPQQNPSVQYFPPQQVPQYIPQQVPQYVHQQTPQYVPQQSPQYVPQQVPQYVPQQGPQYVPQQGPQYVPQPVPPQFYYNGSPLNRQPQFIFVYPAGPEMPGMMPSAPVPPPRDETGDSEIIGASEPEDREPLSPGVAMSGPEVGKRVMPEKNIAVPIKKDVQKDAQKIQSVQSVQNVLAVDVEPTKVESEEVPATQPVPQTETPEEIVEKTESPVETPAPVEVTEPVEIPKKQEVKRHSVLQSRMGSPAQPNVRRAAEAEERHLRAESRGWRRRLAPGLQSVYLDADDDEDEKKGADSVVVGGGDAPSGPSVASVKPAAIALAGPGGVASASPVGTAVVGPGGLAVAAPSATAVAGPSGGVPPGAIGGGSASARSNLRLHQLLDAIYAVPARRAAVRTAPSAYSSSEQQDDYYDQ